MNIDPAIINLANAAGAVGSAIFTGGAALWGIYLFQQSKQLERVRSVKLAASDIQGRIAGLERVVHGQKLSVIVENIADCIRTQVGSDNGTRLVDFLDDVNNRGYLIHAVQLGYARSGVGDQFDQIADLLRNDVFELRSSFPTLSFALSHSVDLLAGVSSSLFRTETFFWVLDKDNRANNVAELRALCDTADRNSDAKVWSCLKINMMQPTLHSMEDSQARFKELRTIIVVIVETLLTIADSGFAAASRRDKKTYNISTLDAKTRLASLGRALQAARPLISTLRYDEMLEALTRLRVQFKDAER